jgi:hypothetical protein
MAFDPDDKAKVTRLVNAIQWSAKESKPFLKASKYALTQYVGKHYGAGGADERVPMGMVSMLCDINTRAMIQAAPEFSVRAKNPSSNLESEAATIEEDINEWKNSLGLKDKLRMAAMCACLSPMGVLKVALKDSGTVEMDGRQLPITEPRIGLVTHDNLIVDMSADCPDELDFIGDHYTVKLEEGRERSDWKKEARENLGPRTRGGDILEDQYNWDELGGGSGDATTFYERASVMDIELPDEGCVVTMPTDGSSNVLKVVYLDAPDQGVYHKLWFKQVPGNPMPLPPVLDSALDLHELINIVFNKLGEMADIEKLLLGYRGAGADNAERIMRARNGAAILQTDGQTQEIRVGGVSGATMAFMLQLKDIFSWKNGNLEVRGGLSSQADTLGQEQLLAGNASALDKDMRDRFNDFVRGIARHLAWFHWTDPLRVSQPLKRVSGTDIRIPSEWSPDIRRGRFLDYNYDIDVFSMESQSPRERVSEVLQIVERLVIPMLPALQAEGRSFSVGKTLDYVADELRKPELKTLIMGSTQSPGEQKATSNSAKSPVTTRNYVRTNKPGNNAAAKSREATMQMLSLAGQGK